MKAFVSGSFRNCTFGHSKLRLATNRGAGNYTGVLRDGQCRFILVSFSFIHFHRRGIFLFARDYEGDMYRHHIAQYFKGDWFNIG